MSKIRETVTLFLNRPLTEQVSVMQQFDFEYDWTASPIRQRHDFFTDLRIAGRSEEFCDYVIERYKQ